MKCHAVFCIALPVLYTLSCIDAWMILQSFSKCSAECHWRQGREATRLEAVQLAQANNIHQGGAQMVDASQAEGISIRPLPSDCVTAPQDSFKREAAGF